MNIYNIWAKTKKRKKGYYHSSDEPICFDYEFDYSKVPEPRLGNIYSIIIILSGNPNIKIGTPIKPKERLASLKNHNSKHLCLSHPKDDWWRKRFKDWVRLLIDHKKANNEEEAYNILSENICSLEFYPYSSKKFPKGNIKLNSSVYTREIVENAMKNGASIIITRARVKWFNLVQGLEEYKRLYFLSSSESSYFTERNIFDKCEYISKYNIDPDEIRENRNNENTPLKRILKNSNLI